jgi:hypothetical protein
MNSDIEQLKKEWFSPQQVQELYDQMSGLQSQVKSLSSEVQRKAKLVTQLKAQKENGEIEAN